MPSQRSPPEAPPPAAQGPAPAAPSGLALAARRGGRASSPVKQRPRTASKQLLPRLPEPTAKSKHFYRKQLFPQQFRGAGIGHGGRGAPLVTKRLATPVGKTRSTRVSAFWSFLSSGPQRTAGGQSTGNSKTQLSSGIRLSVLGSHVKRDQGGPPPTMP